MVCCGAHSFSGSSSQAQHTLVLHFHLGRLRLRSSSFWPLPSNLPRTWVSLTHQALTQSRSCYSPIPRAGKTGVGKSALTNRVFGETVAQTTVFQFQVARPLVVRRHSADFTFTWIDSPPASSRAAANEEASAAAVVASYHRQPCLQGAPHCQTVLTVVAAAGPPFGTVPCPAPASLTKCSRCPHQSCSPLCMC